MAAPPEQSTDAAPHHVEVAESEDVPAEVKPRDRKESVSHIKLEEPEGVPQHSHDAEAGQRLKNDKGWDGKLRVDRATLANPEALSDPEYSDEENVLPGEEISADEGSFTRTLQIYNFNASRMLPVEWTITDNRSL